MIVGNGVILPKYLVKFKPARAKREPWGDIKCIWLTDCGYIGDYRYSGLRYLTDTLAKRLLGYGLR